MNAIIYTLCNMNMVKHFTNTRMNICMSTLL